jgi:hyperosmotically inducible protein
MKLLAFLGIVALAGCTQQQLNNAGHALSSTAPTFANDALIVAQIEGYFVTIDADSALHVAVSSHDGVVKLSGRVKSSDVRRRFIEAAQKTQDVKHVDADVKIDPHVPSTKDQVADFALTAAVEASIASQAGVNAFSVHVDAHGGTVTLRGKVATPALRATILETTRSVSGVKKVVDRLKVAS